MLATLRLKDRFLVDSLQLSDPLGAVPRDVQVQRQRGLRHGSRLQGAGEGAGQAAGYMQTGLSSHQTWEDLAYPWANQWTVDLILRCFHSFSVCRPGEGRYAGGRL